MSSVRARSAWRKSTGYDGRYGTRAGRPFAPDTGIRAVNNRMGTDVESARESHRQRVARGIDFVTEWADPTLDPQWRDERQLAKDARNAVAIENMFDPEYGLSPTQMLAIAANISSGKYASETTNERLRERNMVDATPAVTERVFAKLAARFAKLAAKHGEDRARRMMRTVVRQSGVAA